MIGSISLEGTINGNNGVVNIIKSSGASIKSIIYGKLKLLGQAQLIDGASTFANTPTLVIDGVDTVDMQAGQYAFGWGSNQPLRVILKSLIANSQFFNFYAGAAGTVKLSISDIETGGNPLFFNGAANAAIRNAVNYQDIQASTIGFTLKNQWGYQVWKLSPTAAFTIAANANPIDGEILELNFITGGFAVTLSGLTLQGFPGTPPAGFAMRYRYSAANATWLQAP